MSEFNILAVTLVFDCPLMFAAQVMQQIIHFSYLSLSALFWVCITWYENSIVLKWWFQVKKDIVRGFCDNDVGCHELDLMVMIFVINSGQDHNHPDRDENMELVTI